MTSFLIFYFTSSLILVYLFFLLYLVFYGWRKLEISPSSFFSWVLLGLTPVCYFLGFLRGWQGPLPLANFSDLAFYRYVFYLVLSLALLIYLVLRGTGYWAGRESFLGIFFQTQREFTYIFVSFDLPCAFFAREINLLYGGGKLYPAIHGVIFLVFLRAIPLIQCLLLLRGVFYWQDLQLSLLFLPFSLLGWIYGLVYHSWVYYVEENLLGVQAYVMVRPTPEEQPGEKIFAAHHRGMIFQLTPYAMEKGYSRVDLAKLAHIFYSLVKSENLAQARISGIFYYWSYFLLVLRILPFRKFTGLKINLLPLD